MLRYDREWLADFERALRCEWLETNGIGGFAMSTLLGINTRRYHGLLTASLKPPVARYLLLSKYEETLRVGNDDHALSSNLYPGTTYPDGYRWLTEVRLDPFPIFRYEVGGVVLEKRVFLVRGENTVVVEWELLERPQAECSLQVRPLIAFRDYHSTTHRNQDINKAIECKDGVVSIAPYSGLPGLRFATNSTKITPVSDWYLRLQYPREKERGLDFEEDLFCPYEASFDLRDTATVVASTQIRPVSIASHLRQAETIRRTWAGADEFAGISSRAADQFIVSRPGKTIVAGYPWFTDWGRDTMISLPGLCLATGRPEVAKSILVTFAGFVSEGMIPNRFPDSGEAPEYNTVDASLWYFEAVAKYLEAGNSFADIRDPVYPALSNILAGYRKGTRFEIYRDSDGLIHSGAQLTWMDAVVDGIPVTPRSGKAVEIQALWYNALRVMAQLSGQPEELLAEAEQVRTSFQRQFWNSATSCYDDLVGDGSIRPNQVFALSLTYPLAEADQARSVLSVVRTKLLTPYGLRTLAPSDPKYRGQCTGTPSERDSAYHQGTVWPWLLGPYVCAARRFKVETGDVFPMLREYAATVGCGQIPEIFDGDQPHAPRGCVAQAWSIAEILRTLYT